MYLKVMNYEFSKINCFRLQYFFLAENHCIIVIIKFILKSNFQQISYFISVIYYYCHKCFEFSDIYIICHYNQVISHFKLDFDIFLSFLFANFIIICH